MTYKTVQTKKKSMTSELDKQERVGMGMWWKIEKPMAKGQGYQPEPLKTKFWVFLCQARGKEVSQGLISSTLNGLKYIFKNLCTPPQTQKFSVIKKFFNEKTNTRLL